MIVANLATYPKRLSFLPYVLRAMAPQVDIMNVVLNEFSAPPDFMNEYSNVNAIIPDHDTKDAGKFFPEIPGADYLFLIDDDIIYPADYVGSTLRSFESLGSGPFIGGYHCSIYNWPRFSLKGGSYRGKLYELVNYYRRPNEIARYRKFLAYEFGQDQPIFVDQIGSGTAVMRCVDRPPYDFMRTSQRFVDVRLARWCFERGIARVSLPRPAGWILPSEAAGVSFEETIFRDFTESHEAHVAREIRAYAFRDPRVGQPASSDLATHL